LLTNMYCHGTIQKSSFNIQTFKKKEEKILVKIIKLFYIQEIILKVVIYK
jgi:hypothetical protein